VVVQVNRNLINLRYGAASVSYYRLAKEFRHTFCRVLVRFPEDQPELKERGPGRRNTMSDILDAEIYELVIPESTISITDPLRDALPKPCP